jgi:hypothetical protein
VNQKRGRRTVLALVAALCGAFVGLVIRVIRGRSRRALRRTVPSRADVSESRSGALNALEVIGLDQVAKPVAGLGIFLYILGLLSVNGYLLTFGITDFGLIRTRFIYTGALIVTSALLCALPLVLRPLRKEAWPGIKRDLSSITKKEAESLGFRRWRYRALRVAARLLVEIVWTLLVIAVLILPAWTLYTLPLQQFSLSDYARITSESRDLTPTTARMTVTVLIWLHTTKRGG